MLFNCSWKSVNWRATMAVSYVMIAATCYGREIIVDPRGDHPSISHALNEARPGDTVTIQPGIYREEIRLEKKMGTAAEPILVQADPAALPGSVVIDGSRVVPTDQWQRFISERFSVDELG